MSAISGAFLEFKRQCDIERKIITTHRSEKDFTIAIYCLEKNICIDKEKKDFLPYVKNKVLVTWLHPGTLILTYVK